MFGDVEFGKAKFGEISIITYSYEREIGCSVSNPTMLATRNLNFLREALLSIDTLKQLSNYQFAAFRELGFSVTVPQMEFTYIYIPASPKAPFLIVITKDSYFYSLSKTVYDAIIDDLTAYSYDLDKVDYSAILDKDSYAAVITGVEDMYEITTKDTQTFTANLYDTDPATGTLRLMPLVGMTVKAVLIGGAVDTTIVKDCTVTTPGAVSFSLASTDLTVPGIYTVKFVVIGTGFRKELPENRSEYQTILVNEAAYSL